MDKETAEYDLVIIGGGVSGCLAAVALSKHFDLKILLVEAKKLESKTEMSQADSNNPVISHAGFDARVIALGAESIRKLDALGIDLSHIPAQQIDSIHVSDKGHIGQVQLDAKACNVPYLGKVIALADLGQGLLSKVESSTNIDYLSSMQLSSQKSELDHHKLEFICVDKSNSAIDEKLKVKTKLVLLCDGGTEHNRKMFGFNAEQLDYHQSAIITNVHTQLSHHNRAYERFTSTGPLAFLPMSYHSEKQSSSMNSADSKTAMSVVWCVEPEQVEQLLQLDEKTFLKNLNEAFSQKLGRLITCSRRYSYPLSLKLCKSVRKHRALVIGNAAQSLHPIAGQGFNLGIRDVFDLIEVYKDEGLQKTFDDPGDFKYLKRYAIARSKDKSLTMMATDTLVHLFSNHHEPLVGARNLSLLAMNQFSSIKREFAKYAMGVRE